MSSTEGVQHVYVVSIRPSKCKRCQFLSSYTSYEKMYNSWVKTRMEG